MSSCLDTFVELDNSPSFGPVLLLSFSLLFCGELDVETVFFPTTDPEVCSIFFLDLGPPSNEKNFAVNLPLS